jgi:hypothetical protein
MKANKKAVGYGKKRRSQTRQSEAQRHYRYLKRTAGASDFSIGVETQVVGKRKTGEYFNEDGGEEYDGFE